ncbi:MAG: ABC transporter substrate-binding protein, partial [Gemmatimonadota bacterium]
MKPRSLATSWAFLVFSLAAGCGDQAARSLAGLPEFCRDVLPRVAEHLAGFEHPTGERYGGTAVVGTIGELADGMNALVSSAYESTQHQTFLNLMTLIRFDGGFEPEPYLARTWELNEESTELTFHLRDDVFWHDGTPTTARDVEFTYLRATDPATAFPNQAFWTHYVPGPDGVEVLDDHTILFRLRPHAELLDPWRATAIMPEHLLRDVAPAELRQHPYGNRCPVGNGPFVFEDHRADASWSFVRNPAFPEGLGGPPYLARYVLRIIPEQTTLLTELLTENIDFMINPPASQEPQITGASHLQFRTFPWRSYDFVGWNTRRPQLADARVRRAITMATNRAEIVEALLLGYGEVANAGVPPIHWAFHEGNRDALPYDPAGARALLDEAGWVDRDGDGIRENSEGVRLDLSIKYNDGNQDRQDIAEIMQAQLREVGIAVRPQVVEWATLLSQINTPEVRDFDGVVIGWVAEFRLDDTDLHHSRNLNQPYGWSGTNDPRLDLLLDTLPLIVDRAEAIPLWHDYQELLVEVQPYTYLYFPLRRAGLNRRLQNVVLDARGEW